MADNFYRGLRKGHELDPNRAFRDTRLFEHKLRDLFHNGRVLSVIIMVAYLMAYVLPLLLWLVLPVSLILAAVNFGSDRYLKLPLRLPEGARIKIDRNSPKAQHEGFHAPNGQFFVGTEADTLSQVWQSKSDMLTHWLVVGGTGSGKTVTLLSMVANSLAMGSGVLYSDAKATPDLDWNIATLARIFGRDDDVLTTNYITGTSRFKEVNPERLTNTENPYAIGTADSLLQILASLMSESTDANKIFQDRAIAAMSSMLYALVELRDKGELLMGIDTIRDHLSLKKFIETRHNTRVSERVRQMLYSYLESALPGYQDDKPAEKQPEEVAKQHGYAQSYFTRAVASLTDTYGHIFLTNMGEVDKIDVVLNKRIAVTMLPALEKSTNELQNLGKLNFSSFRDGLRVGLGSHLEGLRAEVLENLPTSTNVPTLLILDELAYQMTDGMAVTAAQARGLGVCMVFAMQDFAGPQKANDKEFQQIVGNTTNKLFMKIEDPEATWQQIKTIAGEGMTAEVHGLERTSNPVSSQYLDQRSAQYQRRSRIDLMDLRDQVEGEGHYLFGSAIIRLKTFTVLPPLVNHLRINRFLCIETARDSDYPEVQTLLRNMVVALAGSALPPSQPAPVSPALHDALATLRKEGDEGVVLSTIGALATFAAILDDPARASGGSGGHGLTNDPVASAEALVSQEAEQAEDASADADPGAASSTEAPADTQAHAEPPRAPAASTFAAIPDEPAIEDDEPQSDASDDQAEASFLGRALDRERTDFLFAFEHERDFDYDVSGGMNAATASLGTHEDDGAAGPTVGDRIQSDIRQALRYPSPPQPELTSTIEDDISASVDHLLELDEASDSDAPPAGSEDTNDVFGGRSVDSDL